MDADALQDALSAYVIALAQSADRTTRASDRPQYDRHLAVAARIFADLRAGNLAAARERVADERRAFGTSFLAGPEGDAAERAWNVFAELVEGAR